MYALTHKKEMPFAIAAGVAAGTAIAAGAAVTATAVVTIAAAVAVASSLVMTVVSLATGDKELGQIAGYVGLAGGVAAVGAGLVSAGTATATSAGTAAANTATNAGTTAAAEAGKAGAAQAATQGAGAVTPAFQSGVGALPASQAGQLGNTGGQLALQGGTGLGTTGTASITPTMGSISEQAAQTAAASVQPIAQGANQLNGVQAPSAISAPNAPTTPGSSGGFWDFLKGDGGKMLGNTLSGVGEAVTDYQMASQRNQIGQNQLDFEKEKYYKNMPGSFGIQARAPTAGEMAQYERDQAAAAAKARKTALTLTGN